MYIIRRQKQAERNRIMKYQPKTKENLRELIKNESIYLGDIDTSLITDMSRLFHELTRADFTVV